MKLNPFYLLAALLLFLTEVLIALFVQDAWIRPYGGDVLVVIFLYCAVKGLVDWDSELVALGVLLFVFVLEGLQYAQIIEKLGLEHHQLAKVILGTQFEWGDMAAYLVGIVILGIVENRKLFL